MIDTSWRDMTQRRKRTWEMTYFQLTLFCNHIWCQNLMHIYGYKQELSSSVSRKILPNAKWVEEIPTFLSVKESWQTQMQNSLAAIGTYIFLWHNDTLINNLIYLWRTLILVHADVFIQSCHWQTKRVCLHSLFAINKLCHFFWAPYLSAEMDEALENGTERKKNVSNSSCNLIFFFSSSLGKMNH